MNRLILLCLLLSAPTAVANGGCEEILERLSEVMAADTLSTASVEAFNRHFAVNPCNKACNLMWACEQRADRHDCYGTVTQAIDLALERLSAGDLEWTRLVAILRRHSDGEVSEDLNLAFSKLLPDHANVLSVVLKEHPHVAASAVAIVDPNVEVADRCLRVSTIARLYASDSSLAGAGDRAILNAAEESLEFYRCARRAGEG